MKIIFTRSCIPFHKSTTAIISSNVQSISSHGTVSRFSLTNEFRRIIQEFRRQSSNSEAVAVCNYQSVASWGAAVAGTKPAT